MSTLNSQVLNTIYEDLLTSAINREKTLLALLPKKPARTNAIKWTVNVGGSVASGVALRSAAPAVSSDKSVSAMIPIGASSLQSAFSLDLQELAVAREGDNVSVSELKDLLKQSMSTSVDELQTGLNTLLYTGTGSVNDAGVVGLTTAISTVDYAGIPSATYPVWTAAVVDNWVTGATGTDKRKVLETDDLLRMHRLIREKGGSYDLIVTTPKVMESYSKAFEDNRNYQVLTIGGDNKIPMVDLGFNPVGYKGTPMIDDAFCQRTRPATEAAAVALSTTKDEGVMYFLKQSDLCVYTSMVDGSYVEGGLYTKLRQLSRNSLFVDDFAVGFLPALVVRNRKNVGVIRNILV